MREQPELLECCQLVPDRRRTDLEPVPPHQGRGGDRLRRADVLADHRPQDLSLTLPEIGKRASLVH